MFIYILLAVAGVLILGKKKPAAPVSSLASNQGGTSTPVPEKITPPFYQQKNADTGTVPKTTLAFPPLVNTHGPVNPRLIPHNNIVLSGHFDFSEGIPVRVPISGSLINETEQTSVAEEQATAWLNNRVGGTNVRQVLV